MGRSHARIYTAIWNNEDFRLLSRNAQWMYKMLLSQTNLTQAGTLPITLKRWASYSADGTAEDVEKAMSELEERRYIVVDHDVEELLVRTFIRNDQVYRQPNVLASAVKDAMAITSAHIKSVLLDELRLLPHDEMAELRTSGGRPVVVIVAELIDHLEPFAKDSPKGSGKGSDHSTNEAPNDTDCLPSDSPNDSNGTNSGKGSPKGSDNPNRGVDGERIHTEPSVSTTTTTSTSEIREDVERLCQHLADRVESNGSKRPNVTQRWRTAARLMIDNDGKTEQKILAAIDWSQDDEFWRSNILSMPKLREKYDQLRLAAQRASAKPKGTAPSRFVEQ